MPRFTKCDRINRLARLSHPKTGGIPILFIFYGERDRTWCVLEYTWGGTGISIKGDDPAMPCWGGVLCAGEESIEATRSYSLSTLPAERTRHLAMATHHQDA